MAPGFPAIFEDADASKSPWINTTDMAEAGYVIVTHNPDTLPVDALHRVSMHLGLQTEFKEIGDASSTALR